MYSVKNETNVTRARIHTQTFLISRPLLSIAQLKGQGGGVGDAGAETNAEKECLARSRPEKQAEQQNQNAVGRRGGEFGTVASGNNFSPPAWAPVCFKIQSLHLTLCSSGD